MSRARGRGRLLAVGAVLLLTTGCAASSDVNGSTAGSSSMPAADLGAARAHLVPVAALPGLSGTTKPLPGTELAGDVTVPGLADHLAAWGYLGGLERTLTGPSKSVTLVTSRSLVFGDAAGATDYVDYVRSHADDYFGPPTTVTRAIVAGRPGYVFRPPACACPDAEPQYVALVTDGELVAWLSITGPKASPDVLSRLARDAFGG